MRLVPIETVAAIVEVKLSLSKEEFEKSDKAATETARLRLRGQQGSYIPGSSVGPGLTGLITKEVENGVPIDDPQLVLSRPTFAVFAFNGQRKIETIAAWLRNAQTVDLVCCLESGCALRARRSVSQPGFSLLSQQQHALARFGECLRGAITRHTDLWENFRPDFARYATIETLSHWDETGSYEHPTWYTPTNEERTLRQRLYEARPSLRPHKSTARLRPTRASQGSSKRSRSAS
jgi:hypothetical protein